jgi:pantetheine-phosphate adenylyltransferase
MNIALYPGSFDPITVGHMDIIKRSAKLFDKTYVVVADNKDKEHSFTIEERMEILKASVDLIDKVEVISYNGIVSNLINELNAGVLVRGIRNNIDFEYEVKIEQFTSATSNAETIYLTPKPNHVFVSSSFIRTFIKSGFIDKAEKFMPKESFNTMLKIIEKRT